MRSSHIALLIFGSANAAKCPFGFGDSEDKSSRRILQANDFTYPSEYFTCKKTARARTTNMLQSDYMDIARAVISQYEALPETVGDNHNPRAAYAGCLVRLAGHDFMDFRTDGTTSTGGSDACVNFDEPLNAGLKECMAKSAFSDVYADFCTQISVADFIIIASEAIMGRLASDFDPA